LIDLTRGQFLPPPFALHFVVEFLQLIECVDCFFAVLHKWKNFFDCEFTNFCFGFTFAEFFDAWLHFLPPFFFDCDLQIEIYFICSSFFFTICKVYFSFFSDKKTSLLQLFFFVLVMKFLCV